MMNRDDTKAKEDGSSSVVGDEMALGSFSGDEANPRIIDKSVAPGTDQSPRDANESEENASGKGEEEESSKKNEGEESREVDEGEKEKEGGDEGEKEKEKVGDEIEPRRNDEEVAIIPSRQHETESHADSDVQREYGDVDMDDDDAEMHAHAVEAEKKLKTKAAESVNTKKKEVEKR
ncbi:unnamed protein product [Brassica rapa]|uniref:Uncharacterized protein n=1 Tax=Brassica campestris TaxID=3711 RepID=A0A8D9G678_BRACM|nr:unnamed protein product [Brassica rapa]